MISIEFYIVGAIGNKSREVHMFSLFGTVENSRKETDKLSEVFTGAIFHKKYEKLSSYKHRSGSLDFIKFDLVD